MPKVNEAIIEPMANEITKFNDVHHSISDSYLAAGLAVLARDMHY
jgi:hypothetical protein